MALALAIINRRLRRKTSTKCLLPFYLRISGVSVSLILPPHSSLSLSFEINILFSHRFRPARLDLLFQCWLTHRSHHRPRASSCQKCHLVESPASVSFLYPFPQSVIGSSIPCHPGSPREALTQAWSLQDSKRRWTQNSTVPYKYQEATAKERKAPMLVTEGGVRVNKHTAHCERLQPSIGFLSPGLVWFSSFVS